MPEDSTVAILLAAGGSTRVGSDDKLWAGLGGEPLIARPLRMLAAFAEIDTLVVVAPRAKHDALRELAAGVRGELRCVEGGARRQDSVAAGIAAAPDAAWYLVHDGARPLASAALARRVLEVAREHGAAVPAVPVADTIKRVDSAGGVIETLPRDELRAAQTPQAFAGGLLRRAHAAATAEATDDAALVEALGAPVHVVEGEAANVKVTAPGDLDLIRALISVRDASATGEGER